MSTVPDVLRVEGLRKTFQVREGWPVPRSRTLVALDGVSFTVGAGEALGIVGESGCGKSTLARVIMRLTPPDAGRVEFEGRPLLELGARALRQTRRRLQMVFQDSGASLSPRKRIVDALAEPLRVHGIASGNGVGARVAQALEDVGLAPDLARRFPHEFSGGQRQRIGIARALMLEPALIVADEPVSALDVSVQAQILNLLQDIKLRRGISFVFISHDLGVVRHFCERTAVMYLGRVIEVAASRALFDQPLHPYTQLLRQVSPVPDPGREEPPMLADGEPPSPVDPPPGCHFHPRCPFATQRCRAEVPALRSVALGRTAACHYAERFLEGPPA